MRQEITIDNIHVATVEILKKIIEICEKLKINYFLAYGTLIGAIRHKGFIPWDDDCDITMLRPDYDKFIEFCLQNERDLYPFKLLCKKNTKNYPYNIPRFNDMRYEAVYENTQKYKSGMFVDIYPLDGVDISDEKLILKINKNRNYLKKMIIWATDDHFEVSKHNKWYRTIIKFLARGYAKLRGANFFLDKLESYKDVFDYEKSSFVGDMVWDFTTIPLKKEWFSSYVFMPFENIDVKVPIGYDEFLKVYYGDYLQLPPVENRVPSHGYKLYKRG